jgi:hypothetical protein
LFSRPSPNRHAGNSKICQLISQTMPSNKTFIS